MIECEMKYFNMAENIKEGKNVPQLLAVLMAAADKADEQIASGYAAWMIYCLQSDNHIDLSDDVALDYLAKAAALNEGEARCEMLVLLMGDNKHAALEIDEALAEDLKSGRFYNSYIMWKYRAELRSKKIAGNQARLFKGKFWVSTCFYFKAYTSVPKALIYEDIRNGLRKCVIKRLLAWGGITLLSVLVIILLTVGI